MGCCGWFNSLADCLAVGVFAGLFLWRLVWLCL